MKIVIQCAATKQPQAGRMRMRDGRDVMFIADPTAAPAEPDVVYARPDDASDQGPSWRELLVDYNKDPGDNPLGLLPSYRLYMNSVYSALADRVGVANLYILSAGWGMLPATFLTPDYDITFSRDADPWKRRGKRHRYADFPMPNDSDETLLFFGSNSYLPLYAELTANWNGPRLALYNASQMPAVEGVQLIRFETSTRTNWQYEPVRAFLLGHLDVPTQADAPATPSNPVPASQGAGNYGTPVRRKNFGSPGLGDLTSAGAVRQAIAEYDALGRDAFLAKYGFGPARRYFMRYEGRDYDSKAIVGAAIGYQHGQPLTASDFSGGDRTVAAALERLGFDMVRLP